MTTVEYLRILTQMVDAVSVEGIERALAEKEIGPTARESVRGAAWRLGMIVRVIDRWECAPVSAPEKPGVNGDGDVAADTEAGAPIGSVSGGPPYSFSCVIKPAQRPYWDAPQQSDDAPAPDWHALKQECDAFLTDYARRFPTMDLAGQYAALQHHMHDRWPNPHKDIT